MFQFMLFDSLLSHGISRPNLSNHTSVEGISSISFLLLTNKNEMVEFVRILYCIMRWYCNIVIHLYIYIYIYIYLMCNFNSLIPIIYWFMSVSVKCGAGGYNELNFGEKGLLDMLDDSTLIFSTVNSVVEATASLVGETNIFTNMYQIWKCTYFNWYSIYFFHAFIYYSLMHTTLSTLSSLYMAIIVSLLQMIKY